MFHTCSLLSNPAHRLQFRSAIMAQAGAKFAGKVAIVTGKIPSCSLVNYIRTRRSPSPGASSGIGAATAVHFSRLGATLSLTGRNMDNLRRTAEQCQGDGHAPPPLLVQADLAKEVDARRVVEETIGKFGRLDVLVNNAGVIELGSIENTSLEQYDRVMNINVRAIYHLTMLATPHLVKSKGNVVNVSSVNGMRSVSQSRTT